ncbi:helix-turn-helix domain-containing protein [Winogradskyella sp.]|uniref:helix-turn-helix domain-containing protein n=1 Tax=Winogradskyella sp. TaxID=1883156 RepID=UPI003514EDD5
MKLSFKFDYNTICTTVLEERLKAHQLKYSLNGFGEVRLLEKVSEESFQAFCEDINKYGINVVENPKLALVQRIKDVIVDMVFNDETSVNVKTSVYLADKLNQNYSYLSNLFSETTFTSIENFIILQKIEYAKLLIVKEKLTLTEIAFKLNYSSVAHLSKQFKNTTGITPSAFQRIISKRKKTLSDAL